MKKVEEMRVEYRREDLGKGVRGKHYEEFKKGSNLVLLSPELSKIFPTNEAVNTALSSLVIVARSATGLTPRSLRIVILFYISSTNNQRKHSGVISPDC